MQKFRCFLRIVLVLAMVLFASIGMGLTGAAPAYSKNRDALSEAKIEQEQVAENEQIDEEKME